MKYYSTNKKAPEATLEKAVVKGLAEDRGLYMPEIIKALGKDMDLIDLIERQQAEIERLHDEVSKTRRKALLEASSKFAGHSDYHGDTILCKLICMAEGKEVEIAKPLDKSEIKSESVKEFVKEHKEIMRSFLDDDNEFLMKWCEYEVNTDNLVKEMVGDTE